MAILMKRQNRTLIVLFVLVIGLLLYYFQKTGVVNSSNSEDPAQELIDKREATMPEPTQEAMGEPVKVGTENTNSAEDQKTFAIILADMNSCLDFKTGEIPTAAALNVESIISAVQADLGPNIGQADRSTSWHLKNHEGVERRVRLEISESDDGQIYRELKYFAVDKDGQSIPMDLPPEKKSNPSDEVVNQMLKEGDVFYKERAAYALFAGDARIEYNEKNGELADFEFQNGERYFRCQNLKTRDSCQCVR